MFSSPTQIKKLSDKTMKTMWIPSIAISRWSHQWSQWWKRFNYSITAPQGLPGRVTEEAWLNKLLEISPLCIYIACCNHRAHTLTEHTHSQSTHTHRAHTQYILYNSIAYLNKWDKVVFSEVALPVSGQEFHKARSVIVTVTGHSGGSTQTLMCLLKPG